MFFLTALLIYFLNGVSIHSSLSTKIPSQYLNGDYPNYFKEKQWQTPNIITLSKFYNFILLNADAYTF